MVILVEAFDNAIIVTEEWSGYDFSPKSKKRIIAWLEKRIEKFKDLPEKVEEVKKMKELINLKVNIVEWITQADIFMQEREKKKVYKVNLKENGKPRIVLIQEDMLATVTLVASAPITSKVYLSGGPIRVINRAESFPNIERI